ncbi:flavodoxin [Levilactobacillus bambusae]|uniref:Flavodoxin-like domain-containing protein n=1 Tax=Levilactobacillus bambusae TaxID=2024736 RepID=A0A2V1MWL3_9LACO|nr:flavodoxin [Levilactobacillus bambusae]PWF99480.1 hypothetical protein DCM90_08510 [Levilactobacillus bambusae]
MAAPFICYFTYTGNSKKIAETVQAYIGGNTVEIRATTPYSSNYQTTVKQAQQEHNDLSYPAITIPAINWASFNNLILVFPNWYDSIPRPVATFFKQADLKGKNVICLVSNSSSGTGDCITDLHDVNDESETIDGISVSDPSWTGYVDVVKSDLN